MKYFTLPELTRSEIAQTMGVPNEPSPEQIENLTALVDYILDPLREAFGKPIHINSGFRCPKLNTLTGGAKNSAHLQGQAADITAGTKNDNMRLFLLAKELNLPFDQLIDENKYSWVHISHKKEGNRGQILHLQ